MSLVSRIGKGLVARPARPAPKAAKPAPSPPLPMAERRRRIAEGHARRNAPVPTSAPSFRFPSATPPRERARVESIAFRPGSPCKAISAATGRQCGLLAGHGTMHQHGNTAFLRVAVPGATSFSKRDELDAAARSTSAFHPATGES